MGRVIGGGFMGVGHPNAGGHWQKGCSEVIKKIKTRYGLKVVSKESHPWFE